MNVKDLETLDELKALFSATVSVVKNRIEHDRIDEIPDELDASVDFINSWIKELNEKTEISDHSSCRDLAKLVIRRCRPELQEIAELVLQNTSAIRFSDVVKKTGNVEARNDIIKKHSLKKGVWSEHPKYPVEDWKYEVSNCDTRLGYWEWCYNKEE